MKVLISQAKYLPSAEFIKRLLWCDVFVILDNVEINKRDYETRTKIKHEKTKWITMNVEKDIVHKAKIKDFKFVEEHCNLINEYYKPRDNDKDLIKWLIDIDEEYYIDYMLEHYLRLKKIFEMQCDVLCSSFFSEDLKGKELIKYILKDLYAWEYISGDNCLSYGLTEEYIKPTKLKLINFEEENKKANINLEVSFIDNLIKDRKKLVNYLY